MQIDLTGCRVIVTGGARGIGAAVVRALAAEGANVCSLDVLDELGVEVAAKATAEGPGRVDYQCCDITSREEVEAVFGKVGHALGGLDALVAAAGVENRVPAESITDEQWERVVEVSLRGTYLTNQAAFGLLRAVGGGRILNFASGAGMDPFPGAAHYAAAKAGVIGWTRSVAHEWGRHNITVNAIAPGMWTPMYESSRAHFTSEQLQAHDQLMASRIPLGGKLGDPNSDLAPLLTVLLSDVSRFVTGQIICIDGGLSSVR